MRPCLRCSLQCLLTVALLQVFQSYMVPIATRQLLSCTWHCEEKERECIVCVCVEGTEQTNKHVRIRTPFVTHRIAGLRQFLEYP
jgi:hypothetical protein